MTTTVTCEQCGKQFTGWFTRRFCDECNRLRRIEYARKWNAAHPDYNRQWYREHGRRRKHVN
ncbi:MAG: hypothetical protein IJQ01_05855 [Selenomonadaceae bacterium]|nr:hypothetical protein [Selenomonadaceae bacterium]